MFQIYVIIVVAIRVKTRGYDKVVFRDKQREEEDWHDKFVNAVWIH